MLAGGPLSFRSALQNVTAQSTLEAGVISMAHVNEGAVYLSNMMAGLGFGDNAGAVHIAGNSTYSSRTKYIAL